MSKFSQFKLDDLLLNNLSKHNYIDLTPIQEKVIPLAIRGESLLAKSATGSGKTHAFLIPILQRINPLLNASQAIIIAPTRELARQIYEFATQICKGYKDIRILLLSGGLEKSRNIEKLANGPQLIIATPGRLKDIGFDNSVISFDNVFSVVLDEADMLMDQGFYPVIDEMLTKLKKVQIMVFSATIPIKLNVIVQRYVNKSNIVDIAGDKKTNELVTHFAIDIHHKNKFETINDFIKWKVPYLLLIFSSKKTDVIEIHKFLVEKGYKACLLHGDLTMRERKQVIKRIKNDEFPIIVASDIASRGIDIANVSEVLNVDLPMEIDFYFHRAGRTGRYDKLGEAYTFFDHDSVTKLEKIEAQGVKFNYLAVRDGDFVEKALKKTKARPKTQQELDLANKIQKAVARTKTTEVKPGYKRKVKTAVKKVEKLHKRKVIKEDIRRQRRERSKSGE